MQSVTAAPRCEPWCATFDPVSQQITTNWTNWFLFSVAVTWASSDQTPEVLLQFLKCGSWDWSEWIHPDSHRSTKHSAGGMPHLVFCLDKEKMSYAWQKQKKTPKVQTFCQILSDFLEVLLAEIRFSHFSLSSDEASCWKESNQRLDNEVLLGAFWQIYQDRCRPLSAAAPQQHCWLGWAYGLFCGVPGGSRGTNLSWATNQELQILFL